MHHGSMAANDVTEPAVQALIAAINAGDREAFFAALTPDATMSDDGTDRDLAGWADREIFTVHGHLNVVSARDGGRSLIAAYRNAPTWRLQRWPAHQVAGRAGPAGVPGAAASAASAATRWPDW